jgi:hypothetical protein
MMQDYQKLQCFNDAINIATMSQIMGGIKNQSKGTIFSHHTDLFNTKQYMILKYENKKIKRTPTPSVENSA